MKNKQMTLNDTSYDYRGIGYTRAYIAIDRMRDNRFIGYIPTKDEWIIAIKGNDGSYCNSMYFMDFDSIRDYLTDMSLNSYAMSISIFLDEFQGDYETEIILQSEGK